MSALVENLDDITETMFKLTCIEAMKQKIVEKGLLGVPCTEEIYLYQSGEALVKVRAWSKMLSLHIVSASGTWLVSSHIDGRGAVGNVNEAWRQFEAARPYIETFPTKSYEEYQGIYTGQKIVSKWDKTMKIIRGEYIEARDLSGRHKTAYIVYDADTPDAAIKAVKKMRKTKEHLVAWEGYADKTGEVYTEPVRGCTAVYVVTRR